MELSPCIHTIDLDNQSATDAGTTTIYEKYRDGYYKDSSATTKMTTSLNGITVPSRTGYIFGGYYTATNGGGNQYINSSGKLTSSADPAHFQYTNYNDRAKKIEENDGKLYAKWTAKASNITLNSNKPQNMSVTPTASPGSLSVTYDSVISTKCTASAAGWSFDGYYTSATGGTQIFDSSGNIVSNVNGYTKADGVWGREENTNLYAHWTANTYKVDLDNQSATTGNTSEIYEKYDTGYYKDPQATRKMSQSDNGITIPVKNGYSFEGYYFLELVAVEQAADSHYKY